jgi:hypothetical protein
MSPLALAAGQHYFAIEDLFAPNAGDGQPVALAAKRRDLFVAREGNRLKSLFARFVLGGSSIKC